MDKTMNGENSMAEKINMKGNLEKGLRLMGEGRPGDAISYFEAILADGGLNPLAMSCLGLAMARAGKNLAAAEQYCLKAIDKKPYAGEFYRSLAEVYFIGGKKADAIECLNRGLRYDNDNSELYEEMKQYGIRRKPPIPFLPRSNILNKKIGKLISSLK